MKKEGHITGIILAGGKSSRMGNDKGLLQFQEKSFLERSIEALKPIVSEIIIVSNNKEHDVLGTKRVEDIFKDAGPLAGVYTGLKHSKNQKNIVLSCDIPLINTETLQLLLQEKEVSEIIQLESQGKAMPLIAMYTKSCENIFYDLLQKGERRLRFAVNQCKVKTIRLQVEKDKFVTNINTKEQFYDLKS
jgi:molybdopterin-guanine dinucleotide biosynthesis protein A